MKFFKTLGKSLLYLILSPIILAVYLLFCIYSIFVFLYKFFVFGWKFITGKNIDFKLDEDLQAQKIIDDAKKPNTSNNKEAIDTKSPVIEVSSQPNQVINNYIIANNIEDAKKLADQLSNNQINDKNLIENDQNIDQINQIEHANDENNNENNNEIKEEDNYDER